jgi:hypothetical protein
MKYTKRIPKQERERREKKTPKKPKNGRKPRYPYKTSPQNSATKTSY